MSLKACPQKYCRGVLVQQPDASTLTCTKCESVFTVFMLEQMDKTPRFARLS